MERMDHGLFKPKSFDEGKHAVVGDCNGFTMQERWQLETPLFSKAILKYAKSHVWILDYGCGVGRMAKGIIDEGTYEVFVDGTDDSSKMLDQAYDYVSDPRFRAVEIDDLEGKYGIVYCIYVLQHVPAVALRETIARIHSLCDQDGYFIYCSSDYRMAIRFDQPGFFDDRFLGVNIRQEIERYFEAVGPLFSDQDIREHNILAQMIAGDLPHPAIVYRPKVVGRVFPLSPVTQQGAKPQEANQRPQEARTTTPGPQKLLLLNRLSPGDILVMTNAIRDLHKAHPGKYLVDVRTPCNDIFENNPHITKLEYSESKYQVINSMFAQGERDKLPAKDHVEMLDDITVIDMQYPLIHSSGTNGCHFSNGHGAWLEEVLGIKIPQSEIRPEIYLSPNETTWINPLAQKKGISKKYWVLNAGSKNDNNIKQYPYFKELVEKLKETAVFADIAGDNIEIVQIGQKDHEHKPLNGVISMIGETNIRELFRLIYHAEGVITCVSFPMHVAAAFSKPCVVIAGAREGTRWELYPNHQFLYVNGCLPCAPYDGCWRPRNENGVKVDCNNRVAGIPKCMTLILPSDIVRSVMLYYFGGLLEAPPKALSKIEGGNNE
jgi:ADP-heptose:LPS heptosyltransferase/SAM-dependent methyltransferase